MKSGSTVVLEPSTRLAGVKKEWHTRKQRGKDVAYLATDRLGEWTVLTQKLPLLTEWINERAEGPGGRVSTTTLYEGADRGENASRVGAWIKGRWCLRTVELEEASAAFESARQGIRSAAVVASEPACYVCSVRETGGETGRVASGFAKCDGTSQGHS